MILALLAVLLSQLKLWVYDTLCILGDHTCRSDSAYGASWFPGLDWLITRLWFAGWEDGK